MAYACRQILSFARESKSTLIDAIESADGSIFNTSHVIFGKYNTILGAAIMSRYRGWGDPFGQKYIKAPSLNALMDHGATLQGESFIVVKEICRLICNFTRYVDNIIPVRYTPTEWPEYKATLIRAVKTFVPTRVTPEDVSEITHGYIGTNNTRYLLEYLFDHPQIRKIGFDTELETFTDGDIIAGKVKSCLSFLSDNECWNSSFYILYGMLRKYIHEIAPPQHREIIYGNFIRKLSYVYPKSIKCMNVFYPDFIRDCVEYNTLHREHVEEICHLGDKEFIEIIKFILIRCSSIQSLFIYNDVDEIINNYYVSDINVWCKVVLKIFNMTSSHTNSKIQVLDVLSHLGYGIDSNRFGGKKLNIADHILETCNDVDCINYVLGKVKPDKYCYYVYDNIDYRLVGIHDRMVFILNNINSIKYYADEIFTSIVTAMADSITNLNFIALYCWVSSGGLFLKTINLIISMIETDKHKYCKLQQIMYSAFDKSRTTEIIYANRGRYIREDKKKEAEDLICGYMICLKMSSITQC